MKYEKLSCPACGAELTIDSDGVHAHCEYCDNHYLIQNGRLYRVAEPVSSRKTAGDKGYPNGKRSGGKKKHPFVLIAIIAVLIWGLGFFGRTDTGARAISNVTSLFDKEAPQITALSGSMDYGKTLPLSQFAQIQDNQDDMPTLTVAKVEPEGPVIDQEGQNIYFPEVGEYQVYLTGTDQAGNESTATSLIKVIDRVPPEYVGLPDGITIDEKTYHYDFAQNVSVKDEIDGDLTGRMVIDSNSLVYGVPGTYDIIYQVEDSSGNTASKTLACTVKDTTAPVLKVDSDGITIDDTDTSYDFISAADMSAKDQIDGDLHSRIVADDSNIQFGSAGEYQVRYLVSDAAGNTSEVTVPVTIKDTTAPVLTLSEKRFVIDDTDDAPEYLKYASAKDKTDGDMADEIQVVDKYVDYGMPGTYKLLYKVKDAAGNVAKKNAEVVIKDTTPPVLTLSKNKFNYTIGDRKPNYKSVVSAKDSADGVITRISVDDSAVDYEEAGTYKIRYTVRDAAGNKTVKKANVVVKEKKSNNRSNGGQGSGGSSRTVYITRTGEKYHEGWCSSLRRSKIPISLEDAIARGYEACKICH